MTTFVFVLMPSNYQLKKAAKEGRLSEAMLDRRLKLKRFVSCLVDLTAANTIHFTSDRFC